MFERASAGRIPVRSVARAHGSCYKRLTNDAAAMSAELEGEAVVANEEFEMRNGQ